jgi:hypothetical protein
MFKILKLIFIIVLLLTTKFTFATPVENVFNDINKDYKYYHELQTLYDK